MIARCNSAAATPASEDSQLSRPRGRRPARATARRSRQREGPGRPGSRSRASGGRSARPPASSRRSDPAPGALPRSPSPSAAAPAPAHWFPGGRGDAHPSLSRSRRLFTEVAAISHSLQLLFGRQRHTHSRVSPSAPAIGLVDLIRRRPRWWWTLRGAVAFAATAVEQRDWPHENAPSPSCSGSTV